MTLINEPLRRMLPNERQSITHKFNIAGTEGYITVGLYEDGSPGELYLVLVKESDIVRGLAESFAKIVSLSLQFGIPLTTLVQDFRNFQFLPSGKTTNTEIPFSRSIVDYLFRWLEMKFIKQPLQPAPVIQEESITGPQFTEAPACVMCGSITIRQGEVYKCSNCGHCTGYT